MMAIHKHNPNPNILVRSLRKIYKPVGFKKGYNAILSFITLGYLVGFCLSQVRSFNVWGYWATSASAPGEAWAYTTKGALYKTAITLHIVTVIPSGLLVALQFIPIIRHKALLFHRLNGYLVILLVLLLSVSGIISSKVAFGGDFATQTFAGMLGIAVVGATALAYVNIKRLQIEQHRAWMMRAWVWAASIITVRIIQIIATQIIGRVPDSYRMMACQQIDSVTGPGSSAEMYPSCSADPFGWTAVRMDLNSEVVAEIMGALQGTFGASGYLALFLHALGIELYLHLTPAEAERLRLVSYERQVERGWRSAGSAGLTADRLGDAEWTPGVKDLELTVRDKNVVT